MDNLKDFTKAEFLSFLYAEKSREIENNAVPGWSKWALLGAIATVLIFLYNTIKINYSEYNLNCLIEYLVLLFSIILILLNYYHVDNNYRTYISGKVRPLKEEAPVLSCIFQFAICIFGSIIQFYRIGISVIFWNLIVALAINLFILIYIIINRNRYVLAQLRTRIFINDNIDFIIRFFLNWAYLNILTLSMLYIIKSYEEFHSLEFELAIGLTSLILLLYLFLKIKYKNNNIAEGLDRLIDRFTIGSISQEGAFRQYILMIYGFSAFQTIENELDIVEKIKNDYNEKIKNIENLKSQVQNKTISFNDLERIQKTLENEISYYSKSSTLLSKLLDKIGEISELGIPAVVDKEFMAAIENYKHASALFSNLITQAESLMQEIRSKIYCSKCGTICLDYECPYRNEPVSLKYKTHRKAWLFFKRIKRRISLKKNK